jgi:hypothetical protein
MIKKLLAWLLALYTTETTPMDPNTLLAAPASPATDQLHTIVDEVLDAAIAATVNRPFIHATLYSAKMLLDLFWPAIFPAAKAKLAAKGINVA